MDDKLYFKLIKECVDLFDELDSQRAFFDPARLEVAEHVCSRLQEILQRSGVEPIVDSAPYDRTLHHLEAPSTEIADKTTPVIILSPGFRAGRMILRRARAKLVQSIPSEPRNDP